MNRPTPATRLPLLSTNDVAERLSVHRSTVIRLAADGELPYIDIGRGGRPKLRFTEEAVGALIEARTHNRRAS